jgi:hypothetical protein
LASAGSPANCTLPNASSTVLLKEKGIVAQEEWEQEIKKRLKTSMPMDPALRSILRKIQIVGISYLLVFGAFFFLILPSIPRDLQDSSFLAFAVVSVPIFLWIQLRWARRGYTILNSKEKEAKKQ